MVMDISVIGIDLAKTVFQLHGSDEVGNPVLRKRLRRCQLFDFVCGLSPCIIAMELR